MKTIDFISLGCSKNLVDSENLMGMFEANGFHVTHDSDEQVARKNAGEVEKIFVMGCLSERYLADLEAEIPEVDGWYGKFNYKELLNRLTQEKELSTPLPAGRGWERVLTTPSHYAYIKISEGCDRHCAYCAIPLITGRHQSRPMEEILDEVRWLVSQGTKEFQVIPVWRTAYCRTHRTDG